MLNHPLTQPTLPIQDLCKYLIVFHATTHKWIARKTRIQPILPQKIPSSPDRDTTKSPGHASCTHPTNIPPTISLPILHQISQTLRESLRVKRHYEIALYRTQNKSLKNMLNCPLNPSSPTESQQILHRKLRNNPQNDRPKYANPTISYPKLFHQYLVEKKQSPPCSPHGTPLQRLLLPYLCKYLTKFHQISGMSTPQLPLHNR